MSSEAAVHDMSTQAVGGGEDVSNTGRTRAVDEAADVETCAGAAGRVDADGGPRTDTVSSTPSGALPTAPDDNAATAPGEYVGADASPVIPDHQQLADNAAWGSAAASSLRRSTRTPRPITFFDSREDKPAAPPPSAEPKPVRGRGRPRKRPLPDASTVQGEELAAAERATDPASASGQAGPHPAPGPTTLRACATGTPAAVKRRRPPKREIDSEGEEVVAGEGEGMWYSSSDSDFMPGPKPIDSGSKPRAPVKKARRARVKSRTLPEEAMHAIIEYMPDARSLHSFALSCKDFGRHIMRLPLSHPLLLPGAERLAHPLHNNLVTLSVIASGFACALCGEKNVKDLREPWNVWAHDECVRGQLANCYYFSRGDEATRMVALGKAYRDPGVINYRAVTRAGLPYQVVRGFNVNAVRHKEWEAHYYWTNKSPLLPLTWTLEGFLEQDWRESRDNIVMEAHAEQVQQLQRDHDTIAEHVAAERKRWATRLEARHSLARVDATALRLAKLDSYLQVEGLGSIEQLRKRWSDKEIEDVLGDFFVERKTLPYTYSEALRRVKQHVAWRRERFPPKRAVVVGTGLSDADNATLAQLTAVEGDVTILDDFDPSRVTHVVAPIITPRVAPGIAAARRQSASTSAPAPGATGARLTNRTLKYMQGIATGAWIVGTDWVQRCLCEGRLVDEAPFEIQGDMKSCGGPTAGRQRALRQEPPLFAGRRMYVLEPLERMTVPEMQSLLASAGAEVLDDEATLEAVASAGGHVTAITLIAKCPVARADALRSRFSGCVEVVDQSWVQDSISQHRVADLLGLPASSQASSSQSSASAAAAAPTPTSSLEPSPAESLSSAV